jgi:hypothetical protein
MQVAQDSSRACWSEMAAGMRAPLRQGGRRKVRPQDEERRG